MSNLYLPTEAKINWAQSQIEDLPTLAGARLRLYSSPLVISTATTLAALNAIQATFPGYTPKLLENWTDAVLVDGKAITEADSVTYQATASTAGTLHGCYVVNGAGDRLLGVSPLASPVPIPFTSELQVSVELDFDSIFSL